MPRSYYAATVSEFLSQDRNYILGVLTDNNTFELTVEQKAAWIEQIDILQRELRGCGDGWLAFEYTIPRMGKRVDNVLIYKGCVFLLEFKAWARGYDAAAVEQVVDYALDLYNFHKGSRDCPLVPVLVATAAPEVENRIATLKGNIREVVKCHAGNLRAAIDAHVSYADTAPVNPEAWNKADYCPTPTIVEAAQVLYSRHSVEDISRNDAGAINLTKTSQAIADVVARCQRAGEKAVCFVTGVPGAGKTLAGLNIASRTGDSCGNHQAVFLSGNRPLMDVLRGALIADETKRCPNTTKKEAERHARAFIQSIFDFRAEYVKHSHAPVDKIVVIDEAQRMWDAESMGKFLNGKGIKGYEGQSEPALLMGIMDRHPDWAVLVCLVGGGQEINRGETGISEWFRAVNQSFPGWHVYVPETMTGAGYETQAEILAQLDAVDSGRLHINPDLHLAVSMRSFRSEKVSEFVRCLLDNRLAEAKNLYQQFKDKYPIHLVRSLDEAKAWVKSQAKGSERYGIVASSGSHRLRKHGIWVHKDLNVHAWFLKGKDDVRSSFYMEEAATEFYVQGLELDWVIVAWDANLRRENGDWAFYKFSGSRWTHAKNTDYLKNAYRVLLTRARQGMVIFVPNGDKTDPTRKPDWYDGVWEVLGNCSQ